MTMLRAMLLPVFALALAGAGGAQALAKSMKDSPEGLALREAAHAECRKPQYAHDTRIVINYAKGWFRCEEPREWPALRLGGGTPQPALGLRIGFGYNVLRYITRCVISSDDPELRRPRDRTDLAGPPLEAVALRYSADCSAQAFLTQPGEGNCGFA
jgi:hypothetical protein